MRTALTGMATIENALKTLLRGVGLLATFAAALAMAQQSTSPENHTSAQPHSSSGASTWGPTRNKPASTAPRTTTGTSSASSSREPYSVKAPSSSASGAELDRKASTVGRSPETFGHAGGGAASSPTASSTRETPTFASSGGVHASAGRRKTSRKTQPRVLSSSNANREKVLKGMGVHRHAKPGTHKSKKHRTW